MKTRIIRSLPLLLLLLAGTASAQSDVAMADHLRQEGKIYVVVTVLALIFAVIVIYLTVIDRKVTALERKTKNRDAG